MKQLGSSAGQQTFFSVQNFLSSKLGTFKGKTE